jgi:hypothetical protein
MITAPILNVGINYTKLICWIVVGLIALSNSAFAQQSPILGISVHLHQASKGDIDRSIAAAADAGVTLIRWDAPWAEVELQKGSLAIPRMWDYIVGTARNKGIESLLILDYGNKFYDGGDKPLTPVAVAAFARYAAFVANHFSGKVKFYEIWNEWELKTGNTKPGNAKSYAALVKVAYPTIKRAAPDTVLLIGTLTTASYIHSGPFGSYFEQVLRLDLGDYCDGISLHPYVHQVPGMRSPAAFKKLLGDMMLQIREAKGLAKKPIYVTEYGWTSSSDSRGVSEDLQAQYITESLDLVKSMKLAMLVIYELRDGNNNPSDPEGHFGLVHTNWAKKPAFAAVKEWTAGQPR